MLILRCFWKTDLHVFKFFRLFFSVEQIMINIFGLYKKAFSNLSPNIWILAFTMFVNRSGAMVLIFTSLYLTNELNFSMADAGIAMSFYGAGSILGSFLGGWLTDRRNFFDIMVFALFAGGITLPFILLLDHLMAIAAVIFLYALVTDLFRPAMSKAIAFYSKPQNRTRAVSLVRLAINLGFSVGPAIGGAIAFVWGYRPLIIIDSITSISAGVLLLIYLPRKPVLEEEEEEQQKVLTTNHKTAYQDYQYLFFILLVAMYGLCFFQLFASVPQYLDKVWKYSEAEIGAVLALNGFLVVLIEMPLMAYLENKTDTFRYVILGAVCVPISFAILYLSNGMLFGVLFYTLIITFSEMYAMPFMMNFTLSRPKKERQGEYAALYSVAFGLANAGAPLIGLGIADKYNFDTMFLVLIIVSSITSIGFFLLMNNLRKNRT